MRALLPFVSLFVSGLLLAACDTPAPTPQDGGSGGAGATGAGGSGASGGAGGQGGGEQTFVVATDKGPVEGGLIEGTKAFLGIPFAAPPVGNLRWKPPASHEPWTEPFAAIKKGRGCPQLNPLNSKFDTSSGEDCLTLNIWAPAKPSSDKVPVLVWIHGGAFVLGSGSEFAYDGRTFAEETGTLVVTINYRLGPLGFLALPDLKTEDAGHPSSGDYGLEDQRFALEWVKTNIAAFGGDPENVTLFGESAGGISTCMQMVSPGSAGLFHRAIIESGPCDNATPEADAMAQGGEFTKALGCDASADVLACLRGKTPEEVLLALPSSADFLGSSTRWFPVLDGLVLPDTPSALIADSKFEKVPVILGSNADEGTLFLKLAQTMIPDDATFATMAENLAPGYGTQVVEKYPPASFGSPLAAAAAAIGDAGFVCPARRAARGFAKAGVPTFLYHFTYAPPGSLLGDLGAFHSSEVKFVFGNPGQLIPQPLTDEELAMSSSIMAYWSNLATKGDANGGELLPWPEYSESADENLVIDLSFSTKTGLKKDLCDFWDTVALSL